MEKFEKYLDDEISKFNTFSLSFFIYTVSISQFFLIALDIYSHSELLFLQIVLRVLFIILNFGLISFFKKKILNFEKVYFIIYYLNILLFGFSIISLETLNHLIKWYMLFGIIIFQLASYFFYFKERIHLLLNILSLILLGIFIGLLSKFTIWEHFQNGGDLLILLLVLNYIFMYFKNIYNQNRLKINYNQKVLMNDFNKDLSLARRIQVKLLPLSTKKIDNYFIHSLYNPKDEVGGDIFDITKLENNNIRIMLADATGHGMQAALITMLIKSEYESIKGACNNPLTLVEVLNYIFFTKYYQLNCIFSMIVVDLDPEHNNLKYCSAGHPDQILLKNNSIDILKGTGKIIGVNENSVFNELTLSFQQNDKLVLFTDGFFEEFNEMEEVFGEDRLLMLFQNHLQKDLPNLLDIIMNSINDFVGIKGRHDDITVIGVEYKPTTNKDDK